MTATLDPISDLQAALLARLTAAFAVEGGGSALRKIDAIEVPFDEATAKTLQVVPPAVYVAPLILLPTGRTGEWTIRWAVYGLSGRATSKTRTEGGASEVPIGSYAIIAAVGAALENWVPPAADASTLRLEGIENLTGLIFVQNRFNVWSATFACEISVALDNETANPGAGFADFLTFHADVDVEPYEDPPGALPADRDATFTVELPGP